MSEHSTKKDQSIRTADDFLQKLSDKANLETGSDGEPWYLNSSWNPKFALVSALTGCAISAYIVFRLLVDDQQDVKGDAGGDVLAFVVISIIASTITYLGGLKAMRRRYAMRAWCTANGWEYKRSGDPFHTGVIKHTDDLADSKLYWSNKSSQNSMSKMFDDRGVVVLERYYYQGRNRDNKKIATFLVMDYGGTAPEMILHPHHITDKLPLPSDLQTVSFESNAFNRKWTVKAKDPKAAYDRLDQSTLEYLQEVEHPVAVEFIGKLLVIKLHAVDIEARKVILKFVQGLTHAVPDDLMPKLDMPAFANNK